MNHSSWKLGWEGAAGRDPRAEKITLYFCGVDPNRVCCKDTVECF